MVRAAASAWASSAASVSGGLEMLEFEGRAVTEGVSRDFLAAAEAAGLRPLLERIRTGYQERTPSGGIHLLYRCPTPMPNTKLARRPATAEELLADPADKIKVLIETRGEGGYVILAPSNGRVHPTGGAWSAGGRRLRHHRRHQRRRARRSCSAWPARSTRMPTAAPRKSPGGADGDRPGDLYDAQPDIHDRTLALLEKHGWTQVYSRKGIDYLRRPGKEEGISATLGHAGPGVLHVFSTSTAFETESHKPLPRLRRPRARGRLVRRRDRAGRAVGHPHRQQRPGAWPATRGPMAGPPGTGRLPRRPGRHRQGRGALHRGRPHRHPGARC